MNLFIAYKLFGKSTIRRESLTTYVDAVRSIHVDIGLLTIVFDNPSTKRLLKGAILVNLLSRRNRQLVTEDMLTRLIYEPLANKTELNFNAAVTLTFDGLFCLGELTYDLGLLINDAQWL